MNELTLDDLLAMTDEAVQRKTWRRLDFFRPYGKQKEFFALGRLKRQRMFNAGNQLGKSDGGAFETACHATGEYPSWWEGMRFDHPTVIWVAGVSALATRDICQAKLCGRANLADALGTGLLPKDRIVGQPTLGRGVTGAFDMIQVRHKSGGVSIIFFKSYEQGWQKFQGEGVDFIWLDEEPEDYKIFTECVTRTTATGGSLIITFTPLNGETELFSSFERGADVLKGFVSMNGDDVLAEPVNHFMEAARVKARQAGEGNLTDEEAKRRSYIEYEAQVATWPIHERETRRAGRPIMGSGVIFPIPRQTIECPAILDAPGHWRQGWGVDFGGMGGSSGKYSHPFAAVFGQWDPLTDIIYITAGLQLHNQTPLQHSVAMKAVCAAAPVFWPHDGHRSVKDDNTTTTMGLYKATGLRMWSTHATFKTGGYSTEAGILDMHQRFTSGRLKVCAHLQDWWTEFLAYHRDENGEIVKIKDDLMSATRILVMMLPRYGQAVPMGSLMGRNWKDALRRPEHAIARGLDSELDPWDP